MKQSFIEGAVIVSAGGIAAKILGAFYRIPLTNLLGGQGMGVYQMVYPLYCLLLTLASAGVPAGLSRIVSVWEARGIPSRGVLSRALLLFGAVGGAGSLLMLAAAGGVSALQGEPAAAEAYRMLAPSVFLVALISCFRGWFQGRHNFLPTALSETAEQAVKAALGLSFAYVFRADVYRAVSYALLSVTASELFALLLLALFGLLLGLVLTCKNNYYEDVLETAETAQSAVTAQKEGQLNEVVPKHVKVGKTGLNKGWGASALYYKHRVENRRSGVFFLSNMALIFDAIIIACAFFMKDAGLAGVLAMSTYMQLFTVALGRFNRELIKPYIYLLPEPPLKKLLYAIKESLISDALEAVVLFVILGFILEASPVAMAFCVLARISFSLLFTAGNVVVERVFGMVSSKTLIFLFYFLVLIVMALPGIAACVAVSILLPALGVAGALLALAAVNAAIAVLALWLCRNLLQYAELNSR